MDPNPNAHLRAAEMVIGNLETLGACFTLWTTEMRIRVEVHLNKMYLGLKIKIRKEKKTNKKGVEKKKDFTWSTK